MIWNIRRESPGISAEADIAAEMVLLDLAFDAPVLRIWQTHQCLVVTPLVGQRREFAGAAAASQARGWPVLVRRTGGGPVPLTIGTLNISMAYAMPRGEAHSIDRGFQELAEPLCAALKKLGVVPEIGEISGSCCPGRYDIAVGGKKLIGIAQRRRQSHDKQGGDNQTAILVHAMLWVEPGLREGIDALEEFLGAAGVPNRFDRSCMGVLREVSNFTGSAADFGGEFGYLFCTDVQ